MYIKMIFGDIKHTAKDYRIYLLTLILLVGIFYGFLSISSVNFQDSFPAIYNVYQLQQIIKYTLSIITLLIIFLISYVNQYILKQKQQEFALLKLMGIKSNIVGLIFFTQAFIIGLIAIFLGSICGMFLSQVVAAIVFLISIIYFYLVYEKHNIPLFLNLLIGSIEVISGTCTIVLFALLYMTDLYPIIALILVIIGIFTLKKLDYTMKLY